MRLFILLHRIFIETEMIKGKEKPQQLISGRSQIRVKLLLPSPLDSINFEGRYISDKFSIFVQIGFGGVARLQDTK